MTTQQAAVLKRIGRSIFLVVIEEGARFATGSPYSIILIPILSGIGKWLRETKELKNVPF